MEAFMNTAFGSRAAVEAPSSVLESSSIKPRDRIKFATPSAEIKYKKILRRMNKKAKKSNERLSLMDIPSSVEMSEGDSYTLINLGKKRSPSSENFLEPSNKKNPKVVQGKTMEDPFIASLGPIPSASSDIFADMSYISHWKEPTS